jgi:Tol biopolymer transport system component
VSWTPDGRFLLYRASGKTGNDIWVLPTGGKPYAFIATPAQENYGRFSPDGRWVAYTSSESGTDEIYVVPFRDRTASFRSRPPAARFRAGARTAARFSIWHQTAW